MTREDIYNAILRVHEQHHRYTPHKYFVRELEDYTNAVCEAIERPDWIKTGDDNRPPRNVESMVRNQE